MNIAILIVLILLTFISFGILCVLSAIHQALREKNNDDRDKSNRE